MAFDIQIGGRWLSDIGPWGGLVFGTLADGGCGDASWTMNLPPTFAHPKLRRGGIVQIFAGSMPIYAGILAEPDVNTDDNGFSTWSFTASGLKKLAGFGGQGFLCLDGSGNTTATPDTAIDAAIVRGLPWIRSSSFSSTSLTATGVTNSLNYLGDLLDTVSTSLSKRWGVDEHQQVYAKADDSTPTWHMVPSSGRFGLADDYYASDVYIRYWDGTKFATAHAASGALYGTQEYPIDGTNFGTLTSAQATALGQGLIDKGKARLGWTNPLSPSRWQLTTSGGTPCPLWMVKSQQVVRLHGVYNEQGQPLPYVDFVIGQTSYDATADTLTISPVGLVARDLTSIIATIAAGGH